MLYKPNKEKHWDSWIVPYKEKFYMFYINVSEGGTRWDGISLAISDDLIHWKEYGNILKKPEEAIWLGTGMIQKVGSTFIMNYSLEYPRYYQRIYFAISKDLIHWEKTENICCPDGKIYMSEPEDVCDEMPRWDSLGIFEPLSNTKPPYYAFCSSNSKKYDLVQKSGVLGLVTSNDGLNWTCLPPAFANPNLFPSFEVPEYINFENRHYAIFSTSSYLGFRYDKFSETQSGGTYYLVSENKLGPYRLPEGDCLLMGTRDHPTVTMNYVGRTFKYNDEILFYHIWGDFEANAYMGLIKKLIEDKPFHLQIIYYNHNELLKGKLLLDEIKPGNFNFIKNVGFLPPVNVSYNNQAIQFKNMGSSAALQHKPLNGAHPKEKINLKDGRIIEAKITIYTGVGAGIYFESENNHRLTVLLNRQKQRVEFGFLQNGWGSNLVLYKDLYKAFCINETNYIKLFVRKEFFEIYINNIFVAGWRTENYILPNDFGIYCEDSDSSIENLKIWEMN